MSSEKYSPATKAESAEAWREWLKVNHQKEENVWLIMYHKSSSIPSITYSEAVDEALCFGWIDSVGQKRDHQSAYRFFSRRNPKSSWSRINKNKIKKLLAAGKMEQAGLAMVNLAKESGTWDELNEVEALVEPADLRQALEADPAALKHWENFPPSSKKIILYWIHSAKRKETRQSRISESVSKAAKNIRANHYRQPKGRF